MLLLFDIDGTLVDTGGAGLTSLQETAVEVFGDPGPPLDLAGSTDGGILRGLFEHFGQEYDASVEEKFYQAYLPRLDTALNDESFGGRRLDGVTELLTQVQEAGHTLGLLTGNIEQGAIAKVSHYGIADFFHFGAYGDDHWDRDKLGPIALERAREFSGESFSLKETLVIGDTLKDVRCAHALGSECLAVATGKFTVEELGDCGADRVVADLVGLTL